MAVIFVPIVFHSVTYKYVYDVHTSTCPNQVELVVPTITHLSLASTSWLGTGYSISARR